MPRHLPHARTLAEAVRQVISSNLKDGYRPSRFIQATEGGMAQNLAHTCEQLILNPATLSWMAQEQEEHGSLLFLEDLVAVYGYDLSSDVINEARRRVEALDQLAGQIRWSHEDKEDKINQVAKRQNHD